MRLDIEITDEEEQLLRGATDDLSAYIQNLIQQEARRLWHIERCKPKAKLSKPVGRPAISAEEKQFKELGSLLEGIYTKLRVLYGDIAFQKIFGEQYQVLANAMETKDLEALARIQKEQPWQRRR